MASIAIGAAGGLVCYAGVMLKSKLGYDDTLDAFGVHGIGGMAGALLTGVFASKVWNSAGQDGLLLGGVNVFVEQVVAVAACGIYAALASIVLLKIVNALVGLRVPKDVELEGLDVALHGEEAYALTEGPGARVMPELATLATQRQVAPSVAGES
jgi:Amt family ammonium transporter